MAGNKNYFEFLDLADESRWHVRDAEARAGIERVENNTEKASVQTCMDIIGELV